MCVVALAIFTVTADAGQLSIALPAIISEFKADLTLAGWIALVYALATASLYLPCGRLSDIVGSGKLFSFGFVFHALCSLAVGFSQDGAQLIVFRGLQAAGSAFIMANNFAIVTALFPAEERGRAMGISGGTVAALGYTLGPIIGGLLTHALGWRANLHFTAALGFVGFIAARKLLPEAAVQRSTKRREPFDVIGMLTFALSISLLLLSLTTAQKGAFLDSTVIAEFFAGLLVLGLFIRFESQSAYPLLDLRLFRIAAFTLGNLARFASFVSISSNVFTDAVFSSAGARPRSAARRAARCADAVGAGFAVARGGLAFRTDDAGTAVQLGYGDYGNRFSLSQYTYCEQYPCGGDPRLEPPRRRDGFFSNTEQ